MRNKNKEPTQIVSLHMPKEMLKQIDELVRLGYYSSRSDFIRAAIEELLRKKADIIERIKAELKDDIPLLKGR